MMSESSGSIAPLLRDAYASEREACVSLWVAACASRDGRAYPGVAERARPKFDNAAAWIVAERAPGVIVGFALVTRPGSGVQSHPPSAVVLSLLAVDPEEQGSGRGRELLSAITDAAAALGHPKAVLHVLTGNESAVRLYEAAGWTAEGPTFEHSLLKRPFQTYVRDLRK
jgi:ribosomal protein S18 acetylase RimI-like enzyme